jgi:transposase-like protein
MKCPHCKSTNTEDIGECSEGCCDKWECNDCKYTWYDEGAD